MLHGTAGGGGLWKSPFSWQSSVYAGVWLSLSSWSIRRLDAMPAQRHVGAHKTAVALSGLLMLGACSTVESWPPPGKTQETFNYENSFCDDFSRRYKNQVAVFAGCMSGYGNNVKLPNGTVLPARRYAQIPAPSALAYRSPPSPALEPPPLFAPEETPSSPPTDHLAFAPTSFLNILDTYQQWILKAAHPLGTLDNARQIIQNEYNITTIVYRMYWHGNINATPHITTLRFVLKYTDASTIDSVDIISDFTNNTYQPFLGAELLKNAALVYIGDRLKQRGQQFASVVTRVFNSNTSVKGALAELLKDLSNAS